MKKTLIGGMTAAIAALGITLAAPANADVFDMCPSTREGVVGGHTTCAFADNVRRAYYASGGASEIIAYSPVTERPYVMVCGGAYLASFTDGEVLRTTHCYGGDDGTAEVVIW